MSALRRWAAVQALAFLAAVLFTYVAARILHASSGSANPVLDNYDQAMPWLGLALLAAVFVAWRPRLPTAPPRAWARAVLAFTRAHRVEIVLFLLIFAFGVFMRFYRFGDVLPPANGLCCEENINAGVAYRAIEGERPLSFLLPRWAAAAGLLLFGYDTFGLRIFFPLLSIATIALLYVLLRQLASAPAALFALALYAAAWWPALRARQPTEGTIETVLFSLLLIVAIRRRSALAALGAGAVAGLLSYEYEAFKIVPIVAVAFVVVAAAWHVAAHRPFQLEAALRRARGLAALSWRPALVFLMAAGIVLTPMIVAEQKGHDVYLVSIHRNEGADPDRVKDNWPEQLKWGAEVLLPVGPNDYPASLPRDLADRELFDPVLGWLALAALFAGIALLARGFRLYFVAWIAVSVVAAGLFLANFSPWKLLSVLPALIVLIALLTDDARSFISTRFGEARAGFFLAPLAIAIALSFWWNADTLYNDLATNRDIQRTHAGDNARIYVLCNEQRERGVDTYGAGFVNVATVPGFAAPHESFHESIGAWGDSAWVCHDLEGVQLPAAQEAWPLRDLPDGAITLGLSDPLGDREALLAELARAYPGLGAPEIVPGPAESFVYYGWDLSSPDALRERGLHGEYVADGEVLSRIDPVHDLSWEDVPVEAPFTARWQGLVYVPEGGQRFLMAAASEIDDLTVTIDGRTHIGQSFFPAPPPLSQGWHVIEATVTKTAPGGTFTLAWALPGGGREPIEAQDLFPLAELTGWTHERVLGQIGDRDRLTTQRIDFSPHESLSVVVANSAPDDLIAVEAFLTEERWRGVWDVDREGEYVLRLRYRNGDATVLIDGEPVTANRFDSGGVSHLEAFAVLTPGPHTIEIIQEFERAGPYSGLTLELLSAPQGAQARLEDVVPAGAPLP